MKVATFKLNGERRSGLVPTASAGKIYDLSTLIGSPDMPPEKLTRAIEAARKANPDGIAIFAAGSLNREKLWPALEAAFKR